jgi:hypothetical protein
MERRAKVELFEQIRCEYHFGQGTVLGVARKLGVHRHMVRQALQNAIPPVRKRPQRQRSRLGPLQEFIPFGLDTPAACCGFAVWA